MSSKYPELSLDELKTQADAQILNEFQKIYRERNLFCNQRDRALSAARVQQEARKRVGRRMLRMLSRSAALTAAESSTSKILAAVSLSILALKLYDTCENLKDMELFDEGDNKDFLSPDEKQICGMSVDEFMDMVGHNSKLHSCINARVSLGQVNPPGCEGLAIALPRIISDEMDSGLPVIELPVIE